MVDTKDASVLSHPASIQRCSSGPGTVCVVVVRDDDRLKGIDGIPISITGPTPGNSSTDGHGVTEFAGRTPGRYEIQVRVAESGHKKWHVLEGQEFIAVGPGEVAIAEAVLVPTGTLVVDIRDDNGAPFDAMVNVAIDGPGTSLQVQIKQSNRFPGVRIGRYTATAKLGAGLDPWTADTAAAVTVPEDGSATIRIVVRPLTWIEIELVDTRGRSVADEAYRVVTPDGREFLGKTDGSGRARIERIKPGQCLVSFPALDANCWCPV